MESGSHETSPTAKYHSDRFKPRPQWLIYDPDSMPIPSVRRNRGDDKSKVKAIVVGKTGYKAQRREEPDFPDRPNNVCLPVPTAFGAHGPFDSESRKFSLEAQIAKLRGWFVFGCGLLRAALGTWKAGIRLAGDGIGVREIYATQRSFFGKQRDLKYRALLWIGE